MATSRRAPSKLQNVRPSTVAIALVAIGVVVVCVGFLLVSNINAVPGVPNDGTPRLQSTSSEMQLDGKMKYTYENGGSKYTLFINQQLPYDGRQMALGFDNSKNDDSNSLNVRIMQDDEQVVETGAIAEGYKVPVLRSENLKAGECSIIIDVVDADGKVVAHFIDIDGQIVNVESITKYVDNGVSTL